MVYVPSLPSAKYLFYYDRFEWDQKVLAALGRALLPDLAYQAAASAKIIGSLPTARHYDELLFAAIGSIPFSSIAKCYPNASISTFDDGTLHADAQTLADWIEDEPITHRIYRRLTGAASNASVMARIQRHYTIFPADLCTLDVAELIEVPLFANLKPPSKDSKRIRVLLGTPETELVLGIDEAAYSSLISKIDPDVYLPHPRERRSATIRVREADAGRLASAAKLLAAEDFIQELVEFGYDPTIEGFGSTALLNLSRHFETKTYYPAARRPQSIFAKFGVASEPLEPLLG